VVLNDNRIGTLLQKGSAQIKATTSTSTGSVAPARLTKVLAVVIVGAGFVVLRRRGQRSACGGLGGDLTGQESAGPRSTSATAIDQ
jgi:hypothetical protein